MDRVYDLPYTRRPHPSYTRADPRFRDDQGFGDDHARLLRRLHLLLDHGPSGPHHPIALAGIGPERSPQNGGRPGVQRHHQRRRRPDRQHVPDALHPPRSRGQVQTAVVRSSDDLQAAGHRSRPADRADAPRPHRAGHSQGAWSPAASAWTWPSYRRNICANWRPITSAAISRSPRSTPTRTCWN